MNNVNTTVNAEGGMVKCYIDLLKRYGIIQTCIENIYLHWLQITPTFHISWRNFGLSRVLKRLRSITTLANPLLKLWHLFVFLHAR